MIARLGFCATGATEQGEMGGLATRWGVGVGDRGELLGAVGVDDSSNKSVR